MTILIPDLPTPVPQSTDPQNFAPRADALLNALPGFVTAANNQAKENNQLNTSTVAAAAAAAASSSAAKNASDLAVASASAGRFDPTATYPLGALAWSPVDGLIYRRLAAGKAATDPSSDKANWTEARNLPVGAEPHQVPAGQHLGALAYADAISTLPVSRHARTSQPGDVWREWTSDTATTIKFHGFDGVIRTRTEAWT